MAVRLCCKTSFLTPPTVLYTELKRLILILITLSLAATAGAQLNTERLMNVGRNALYFRDYVLSIQYFNSVIAVKPHLAEPYFFRAVAKIELEDYVGAGRDLDSALRRNPFTPAAYYARSYVSCRTEQWQAAESDILQALRLAPDNVTYRLNLINIYEATDRADSALVILRRMIRQSPHWPELRLEQVGLLIDRGDTVAALLAADSLIADDRANPQAYAARAAVRLMMDSVESALTDCSHAIALGSRSPGVYINRGLILARRNRFNEALADYDRAIELDPAGVPALFNRALLRNQLGDRNRALDDLDRLVDLRPDLDEARYVRAEVNARLGNSDRAIADYSAVLDRHPAFVPALYARADLYDRQNQAKKAYLDRERAARLMEDHRLGRLAADTINTDAHMARDESIVADVASLFVSDQSDAATEQGVRGMVQNRRIDLSQEPDFVVSYYRESNTNLIYKEYDPIELQEFVRRHISEKHLYMVTREVPVSSSLSDRYFSEIEGLTRVLVANPRAGRLYVVRALDYAALRDFGPALDDLTRATLNGVDEGIVYFMRSQVRFKQWEAATDALLPDDPGRAIIDKRLAREWELVLRDLDRAAELMPEAGFVHYNKGNLMALKGEYSRALSCYTTALSLEPGLGEAYFNRGLTLMLLGRVDDAIDDMSRAGERGIYRAYRIIKELKARKQ